jgi:lactate racemase
MQTERQETLPPFEFDLPYGSAFRRLSIPAELAVDIIAPTPVPASDHPQAMVEAALDDPIDGLTLDRFRGARSAAIAINDKTRPVLHEVLLPPLLKRLESIGIPSDAIELIVATGTHVPSTQPEIQNTYPVEVVQKYRITSHNCDDEAQLVTLGSTVRGTPVRVNRRFS